MSCFRSQDIENLLIIHPIMVLGVIDGCYDICLLILFYVRCFWGFMGTQKFDIYLRTLCGSSFLLAWS